MSEESRFFRKKQMDLMYEGESLIGYGFLSVIATIGGAASAFLAKGNRLLFGGGIAIAIAGGISMLVNTLHSNRIVQDSLDLNAAKVGLLPIENLGKRHVVLLQQEKEDLKAAMDIERRMANDVTGRHGGPFGDRNALEAGYEKALAAAREEWQKRVQARTQEPTNKTR